MTFSQQLSYEWFNFFVVASSPGFGAITILYFSHLEAVLIYISMISGYIEHLSMCLLATCVFSSVKNVCFSFAHFLIELFDISCFWLCQYLIHNCFLQVHHLSLHPLNVVFHRKKNDEVQFISFSFCGFCFWCQVEELFT